MLQNAALCGNVLNEYVFFRDPQKLNRKLFNPLPDDKLYSSEVKEIEDNNFKFDEIGSKLSKQVENTVG